SSSCLSRKSEPLLGDDVPLHLVRTGVDLTGARMPVVALLSDELAGRAGYAHDAGLGPEHVQTSLVDRGLDLGPRQLVDARGDTVVRPAHDEIRERIGRLLVRVRPGSE